MATFQDGYQAALDDIAAALDRDGDDGAWAWIHNNAEAPATRATVRHMVRPEYVTTDRPDDRADVIERVAKSIRRDLEDEEGHSISHHHAMGIAKRALNQQITEGSK